MSGSRSAFRYRIDLPARVHFDKDPVGLLVRTLNLSRSGIGIRLDLPFNPSDREVIARPSQEPGSLVRIAVYDQVGGSPLVRQWSGRVSHAHLGCGGGRFGIAFDWPEGRGARSRSEVAALAEKSSTGLLENQKVASPPIGSGSLHSLAVALGGMAVDQGSKLWATAAAGSSPDGWLDLISGVLAIAPVRNPGALGSLAQDHVLTGPLCAAACLAVLGFAAGKPRSGYGHGSATGLGLLAAGMLGNSADRLILGHVRDFLVLGAFPHLAFNVADMLILLGAASLLVRRGMGKSEAAGQFIS